MTKKKGIFLIALSLTALLALVLPRSLRGKFTLSKYTLDGIPSTYSVESNVLSCLGRSRLSLNSRKLRANVMSLPYIENVSVKVRGNSILLSGSMAEDAIIITDGDNWYFYSDEIYQLEKKDVGDLGKQYIVLLFEKDYLQSALSSSFSSKEMKMIDTLRSLKESSCLITKAEYDNNNSSVFSGSLLLGLDDIRSSLVLYDIREIGRLEETLGIIEGEYYNSKDRVSSEETEYVLQNGSLVRLR